MAILKPYSYNGTSLQSTDYDTSFPRSNGATQPQAIANYVKRGGALPVYAGKEWQSVSMNLSILCLHDTFDLLESINKLFDTKDITPRQFIVTDEQDSNKQYYVYATPRQVIGGNDGNDVTVTLALDDPIWRSVTEYSTTDDITTSTDNFTVAVGGNDYAYPYFEITPTSLPSTDFIYNTFIQVLPQTTSPAINRPMYIKPTSGTWDTAALVTGGKLRSDGADIRVLRDNKLIDFQVSGINSTDTKILINTDMPESRTWALKTAIAGAGTVSRIVTANNAANLLLFNACPATGRLVVYSTLGSTDTEEFTYTGKATDKDNLYFEIGQRACRNTVEIAHATTDTIAFLPYDFNIMYGNPSALAYSIDSTRTPIIDLAASNNSSFVYNYFYDTEGKRSGAFTPSVVKVSKATLTRSGYYTSTDDVADVNPATAMGIKSYSYQELGVWKADTVDIVFTAYFADKISTLSASGQQYANIAASPAHTFSVAEAKTPTSYTVATTIAKPATTDLNTWVAWTKATTDFGHAVNKFSWLAFRASGSLTSTTDNYAKIETNSLTVGFSNPPHIVMRTEINNYRLDIRITNETTGDYIDVFNPMTLSKTLYIDTDPDFPNVQYDNLVVNSAVTPSTIRSDWLPLAGGQNNLITYENNSGASNIKLVMKWHDRLNFF